MTEGSPTLRAGPIRVPLEDPKEAIHLWAQGCVDHGASFLALDRNTGEFSAEAIRYVGTAGLLQRTDLNNAVCMSTDMHDVSRSMQQQFFEHLRNDLTAAENFARSLYADLITLDPDPRHHAVAALGLKECGGDPEDTKERRRLAQTIVDSLLRFAESSGINVGPVEEGTPRTAEWNGRVVFWWDDALAAHLEKLGEAGGKAAAYIRDNAAKQWDQYSQPEPTLPGEGFQPARPQLWELWLPRREQDRVFSPPYLELFAGALWLDRVAPELAAERDSKRRHWPGVSLPIAREIHRLHTAKGTTIGEDGNTWLIDQDKATIATLTGKAGVPVREMRLAFELARKGAALLGSANGHRVVRWLLFRAHEQVRADGGSRFSPILRVDGGFRGMAEAVGAGNSNKAGTQIRQIVHALSRLDFPLPDKSTGDLLTFREYPARRGQQAVVSVTPGEALLPNYLFRFRQGENRAYVPAIEAFPPLVGRLNEQGAQVTLQDRVLIEFRLHADQFFDLGGVLIPPDTWVALLRETGVAKRLLDNLLWAWTMGKDGVPPWLARDGDLFTLSDDHADVREVLAEAGKLMVSGKKGGESSVRGRKGRRPQKKTEKKA